MEETDKIIEDAITTKKDVEVVNDNHEAETVETIEDENVTTTRPENPPDYDSGDSYSESGEQVDESRRSGNSESGSDHSVILEREEGDGQESVPAKKVDDDEDKKNPQYIPKRGTFYEHDDRTADDNEAEAVEEPEKADKDGKKKIWTDKKEKWSHDKFNDNEQAPKSRSELVAIYGYDIRNEEGPPRARRRRRYGRGPNKYTRNWEDEDAYNKPPVAIKKTPNKSKTSTKPMTNNRADNQIERHNNRNSEDGNYSGRQSSDNYSERTSSNEPPMRPSNPSPKPKEIIKPNQSASPAPVDNKQQNNKNQRVGTGRIAKSGREIKDSDYRGFTKQRQFNTKPPMLNRAEPIQTQNYTNKRVQSQDLERDMSRMSLQEQGHSKGGMKHVGSNNNRQGSMPPRLQGDQKGSKRYSSIRQRSLPESVTPPFNQQQQQQQQHNTYYAGEYNQQNQPNQAPPPMIQHQPHPNPAQMPSIPPPPLPTIPQQVPVTSTPLPPQFAAPFPQPPVPFLQAPPPPFLPQPTPSIINYVQGQPQFAPPPAPYQGYQQPFNPVTQPTEIYQPPGGITYYNAQDQQAAQRAALQKRPKAAIPIVPPPPLEPRGRGRSINQESAVSPNPAEITQEIIIDSNSYEDIPVQQ